MESLRNQIKKMAMGASSDNTEYDDITDLAISSARADMIRAGVNEDLASAGDDDMLPLVRQCVIFYGISFLSVDSNEADKSLARYQNCVDELRKSDGYKESE